MNHEAFQRLALRTEAPITPELTERVLAQIRAIHAIFGKLTELGELCDAYKKYIFYGKPLDYINVQEEVGDGFWYDAVLLDDLESDFGQEMDRVINKLRARYPEKFTEHHAENRDLEKEREVLENRDNNLPDLSVTEEQTERMRAIRLEELADPNVTSFTAHYDATPKFNPPNSFWVELNSLCDKHEVTLTLTGFEPEGFVEIHGPVEANIHIVGPPKKLDIEEENRLVGEGKKLAWAQLPNGICPPHSTQDGIRCCVCGESLQYPTAEEALNAALHFKGLKVCPELDYFVVLGIHEQPRVGSPDEPVGEMRPFYEGTKIDLTNREGKCNQSATLPKSEWIGDPPRETAVYNPKNAHPELDQEPHGIPFHDKNSNRRMTLIQDDFNGYFGHLCYLDMTRGENGKWVVIHKPNEQQKQRIVEGYQRWKKTAPIAQGLTIPLISL